MSVSPEPLGARADPPQEPAVIAPRRRSSLQQLAAKTVDAFWPRTRRAAARALLATAALVGGVTAAAVLLSADGPAGEQGVVEELGGGGAGGVIGGAWFLTQQLTGLDFGGDADICGARASVAAPHDASVRLLQTNGSGLWEEHEILDPPVGAGDVDDYAQALACLGPDATAVGATRDLGPGVPREGVVYLHCEDAPGGGWSLYQSLTHPGVSGAGLTQRRRSFGRALAAAETSDARRWLLVGAPHASELFVFSFNASAAQPLQLAHSFADAGQSELGCALAAGGDWAVASVDCGAAAGPVAAQAMRYDALGGAWALEHVPALAFSAFSAVALASDTLALGAPTALGGNGSAAVLDLTGGNLTGPALRVLVAPLPAAGLGAALSVRGGVLAASSASAPVVSLFARADFNGSELRRSLASAEWALAQELDLGALAGAASVSFARLSQDAGALLVGAQLAGGAPGETSLLVLDFAPTASPTRSPSASPSASPSRAPSRAPSRGPSASPSRGPSVMPSPAPSRSPSVTPTAAPTPEDMTAEIAGAAVGGVAALAALVALCCCAWRRRRGAPVAYGRSSNASSVHGSVAGAYLNKPHRGTASSLSSYSSWATSKDSRASVASRNPQFSDP